MFHTGVPYFGYTEQEVKEVFTALSPRLCAYIDGVTGRGDLGDDIIQEIFYKFLRRRPCLDRAKVPSYLALCDFLDAPNDSPLATLLIEEVLALCDRLPPRTARIFRMSRIDGLTNREIAERLHIAQRTVEKHISLSIRWFRRSPQFKDRWPDSE